MSKFISNTIFVVFVSAWLVSGVSADEGSTQVEADNLNPFSVDLLPVAQSKLSDFEREIDRVGVEQDSEKQENSRKD
ncbi:hypothetical protein SAMN02745866_03077 [Alteromonadaceae bacterium Bs31]|nr:hypothetical protein SAMN02745866_03077 [Alteromonadaceae bacterium Bs31]